MKESGGGGCYPFGLQYKHNWLVHEKSEQWEGSDPTGDQRARPTGALHHLHTLYGKGQGERMVGRKRRRKMEGYSNRKIFACFSSIKTSETGFVLFRAANMYALFLYDNNLTCLTHAKT